MDVLSGYRLSSQQKQLLLLQQHRQLQHAQLVIRLKGDFNKEWLKQAVEKVIRQDTVFRTTYIKTAGMEWPVQIVNDATDYIFTESRISDITTGYDILLQAAAQQVFDLEQGPLIRIDVANASDAVTFIVVTMPALCADFCSITVLADLLIQGYFAVSQDNADTTTEILPYLQFSEWQQELSESEGRNDGIEYWNSKHYQDKLSVLPFDKDPQQSAAFEMAVYEKEMALVPQLADAYGDRLEPALGLCWQWMIWVFSGRQEIVTGHINSGRDFVELNQTLGLFSRCLPVSAPLTAVMPFNASLNAYCNVLQFNDEYKVFYTSHKKMTPLSYVFEYLDMPLKFKETAVSYPGTIDILQRQATVEATKIQLRCIREKETWKLIFCYNSAAFDEKSIQLLAEIYTNIVTQCLADVTTTPDSLRLLSDTALLRMEEQFNNNSKTFDKGHFTVDQLFDEQVALYPQATAIVAGNTRLSYRELQIKADALASYLRREKNVKNGDLVALMCEENEYMIIGMLGILKAGASYVPLDPANPAERIRFILNDSNATILLTQRSLIGNTGEYKPVCFEDIPWTEHNNTFEGGFRTPATVTYVIYTSGTTGMPKGVLIADRSLVNYVCWLKSAFHITEKDSAVLLSSFAFDLGYTAIWGMLLSGGCLHLVPESMVKQPDEVVEYIRQKGISFIKTTPSLFHVIVYAVNAADLANSSLRLVLMGGEPIRVRDLEQMIRIKPGISLANHYGPTEATIGTIATLIDKERLRSYAVQPVIGRPVTNSIISILDEKGCIVTPGIPGELCISGVGLAAGYLYREELTRSKFVSHPAYTDRLMYRTGDQASWTPAGDIRFIGRMDDQVKIRGYRVELNEVQHALTQHAHIKRAAVIAIDTDDNGKELAAYYESDAPVITQELRTFLGLSLPDAFIPSHFIPVEKLPVTANGKLDRTALPDLNAFSETSYIAPRSEMEEKMVILWQTLLNKPKVGVKDDFFDLGGHSLKAIQLATHIHKQFNVKIEISKIFANPTVEQLAVLIAGAAILQFKNIQPLKAKPAYELSHAQQRIWVLSQFEDGAAAYNVPSATILEGPLDVKAFRHALNTLVSRHESLRTVFVKEGNRPMQRILPVTDDSFPLPEKDMRGVTNAEDIVKGWIAADIQAPFNLETGPLLRATLIRMEDEQYIFLFNIHHIVSDGWSRGLLASELLHHYHFYANGTGQALPPLRLQYKDYAAWHAGIYKTQAEYWQRLYSNNIPVLNFPADFERPSVLSFSGGLLQRTLPAATKVLLQSFAQQHGITLNNLMFALYGMLLTHYTGQQEVVIGSLVSGRSHVDLENMLGVFINFLPVRVKANPASQLDDYLRETHHTLLQSYQHQDYPFDLMVDTCIRERDMSHNPFFDTMVNFHSENEMGGQALSDEHIRIRPFLSGRKDEVHAVLDFKLDIHMAGETLELYLAYNNRLFTAARMETFLNRYITLLDTVLTAPSQSLDAYFPWTPEPSALQHTNDIPVNICASFVIEPLNEYLQYWSREFEMGIQVNFAPYNQVFQQLYNKESLLYSKDGMNVLFIRPEDWIRDVRERAENEQIILLERTADELLAAFNYSRAEMHMPYLIGLVPLSSVHDFSPQITTVIHRIHHSLKAFFGNTTGCYLLDMEEIVSLYAVEEMFDAKTDEVGHMPFTIEYYAALGTLLARKIRAWKAVPYKVIAIDCDNTLWKGICGEAGPLGVRIDEHFTALQQFLLKKYNEGFLLVLNSKNNEADVWEVFDTNPGMLLRREHIIAHRINWEHKAVNLNSLAKELNLATDSFIFLDDSAFEVEQMSAGCPEVLGLTLPEDTSEIAEFLQHNWAFDRLHLTSEDRGRNEMYKAEKERKNAQSNSGSIEDFMLSLNIRVHMEPLTDADIERAVQLTQRTNQFNLNGKHTTVENLRELMKDSAALHRIIKVEDRFGNYGSVGLLLASINDNSLMLDSFLLSCRVLGRGVEDVILEELYKYAARRGIIALNADFIPTAKNKPFSDFLERSGWTTIPGKSIFTLPVVTTETVC